VQRGRLTETQARRVRLKRRNTYCDPSPSFWPDSQLLQVTSNRVRSSEPMPDAVIGRRGG
jgi:hypothetical protein